MTDEEVVSARFKASSEADFAPFGTRLNPLTPDERSAAALEYIAFQLGRIRQMLEQDREPK